MLDSRRQIRKLLDFDFRHSSKQAGVKFTLSFLFAWSLAFIPEYAGLSPAGVSTLFILLFAASLWVSEAIPAFSVSLLIIALEIVLLGFPGFDFSSGDKAWESYLKPWSSPLVFLFLAGFIMAAAASKTKLDLWLAKKVLFFVGDRPKNVMTGLIVITFVLSMFVSNTATTAMMMAVLTPILAGMRSDNPMQIGILLAVTVAANIGGMGTIIGTPPNAIAVGILGSSAPSFVGWIMLALPPAVMLVILLRWLLLYLYPSNENRINIDGLRGVDHFDDSTTAFTHIPTVPSWKKIVVAGVFVLTITLWLTGPLHHIPTTVVSFLPVVIFTIFGIIDVEEIRMIRWDVIILIIGGLSLGQAVSQSGLAAWMAALIPLEGISFVVVVGLFAYAVVVISNFMSNTAASNIVLPLVMAVATGLLPESSQMAVVAVALSASFAMMLPVSTPPNAIVYSSGKIHSRDFLRVGLAVGLLGPVLTLSWLYLIS